MAAEAFVDKAGLSEYDVSNAKPAHFEFEKKAAQLSMRVPLPLFDTVKEKAKLRGIPHTRSIREVMERDISEPRAAARK